MPPSIAEQAAFYRAALWLGLVHGGPAAELEARVRAWLAPFAASAAPFVDHPPAD